MTADGAKTRLAKARENGIVGLFVDKKKSSKKVKQNCKLSVYVFKKRGNKPKSEKAIK